MSLIFTTPRFYCLCVACWFMWASGLTQFSMHAQVSVKITSSAGNDFDYFGEAVSIDGDYAVVGSWLDDNGNGKDAGAARVYRRIGAAWEEEQVLLSSDGEAGDQLGYSVCVNGDFIFVGAHRDDNDNGPFAGAVYVFQRINNEWVETARLMAPNGNLDHQFGAAIASRGNRLIVGAPGVESGRGAAYVFHRVQTSWQYVNTIAPSDGQGGDAFGASVAIEGEYAIVGARNHDVQGFADAGAAYAFVFNGAEWVEQARLASVNPIAGGLFGHSVAITSTFGFVGAPKEDALGQQNIGSVQLFLRNGVSWSHARTFAAFDGAAEDEFGYAVVAEGDYAVFGSRWHRNSQGDKSGAAYLYRLVNSNWQSEAQLFAIDGSVGDQFGSAVDFNNEQVIVGARWDDNDRGQDAGAAYIFPVGGAGVPSLFADQQLLNYGIESVGEDGDILLTLSNNGTADLNITDVRIEGGDADHFRIVQGGGAITLAPLASVEMRIEFRPISPGAKQANLIVMSNSPASPEVIELLGEGVEGLQPGVAQVLASRGEVALSFGSTVAVENDYMIVGAEGQRESEPGAAYIYLRDENEWVQQSLLTALDGNAGDRFGSAVSISETHAIVGAWNSEREEGAAYIFLKSGSAWIQQAKLTASDGSAGDQFGRSVSIDGEFAVVGAWQNENERGASAGAVYVYRLNGSTWSQYVKLLAPDGEQGDRFGSSVAVQGNRIIAGAANGGFFGEGRAYVFSWADPVWTPEGVLVPEGAGLSDGFGSTVTIDGDLAVIGAPLYDRSTSIDEGIAYIFERDNSGQWILRTKVEAVDGASGFQFGTSVDIQGNEVIVGAPGADNQLGAVYVYLRSGNEWTSQHRISPSDGQDGESFGRALAYAGFDLIIGAPENSNVNGANAGIVYLYSRAVDNWNFESTVLASNRLIQPLFGTAVAISDSFAVVGAQGKEGDSGAAYVFERVGDGWTQVSELAASDGAPGDLFGKAVAVSGNVIVVGAPGDDNERGVDAGAAYIFLRGSMGWSEQVRLVSSDGTADDQYGSAVTIDGSTISIGAPLADTPLGSEAGKVYIYEENGPSWAEQVIISLADGTQGDNFGTSLALENTTLVIGATETTANTGRVYVFEEVGFAWVREAVLTSSDVENGDRFGSDVDIDDNYIIAGAPLHNSEQGAAYVFRRTSGQWGDIEESKIESAVGQAGDQLGTSVSLSGNYALLGAPQSAGALGASYLFERDGVVWLQQTRFVAPDQEGADQVGQDVALDGENALIGASFDSNGNGFEAGSVYFLSITGPIFVVDNEEEALLPESLVLDQNYPNPARTSTTISFSLPSAGPVTLSVYDLLGRRVGPVINDVKAAGTYEVVLDVSTLPSGTYLYTLDSQNGRHVRTMTVVR